MLGHREILEDDVDLVVGVWLLVVGLGCDEDVNADLEGSGTLEVEGERVELREGYAALVPAGAKHRFVGYEQLSVLVIFEKSPR